MTLEHVKAAIKTHTSTQKEIHVYTTKNFPVCILAGNSIRFLADSIRILFDLIRHTIKSIIWNIRFTSAGH